MWPWWSDHHIWNKGSAYAGLVQLINELLSGFGKAIELFVESIHCLEHIDVQGQLTTQLGVADELCS